MYVYVPWFGIYDSTTLYQILKSVNSNRLGHTKLILWITDSQQKKMERANFFFVFLKNFFDFPKKWSERRNDNFFFKKNDFPQKWGEQRRIIFFSKKET